MLFSSQLYSCYITKFDQVRFEPLCVRSTRSPRFVIDLNFQNLFVHFGMTESSILVTSSSLSWSRFSSRCNRLVPLCHIDSVGIYILTGKNLENFLQPSSPAHSSLCLLGLRIVDFVASHLLSLVSTVVNGFHLRRCRCSESTTKLGYGLNLCAIHVWFQAHCILIESCHD